MLEQQEHNKLAVLGPLSGTLALWAPCKGWTLVGELAGESEELRELGEGE